MSDTQTPICNPDLPKPKVVVQCSGGVESTILLAKAIQELGKENVFPIVYRSNSVFWTNRDSTATKRVLTRLGLNDKVFYCDIANSDALEYPRDEMFEDVGFIPGYKLIMNVNALSYAQKVGASQVWIGNMADNVYPDETAEFMNRVLDLYNDTYTRAGSQTCKPITIEQQFFGMTKAQVAQMGYELLGEAIFDTLSCGDERVAGGFSCGVCPWCKKRHKGFMDALGFDHTPYLHYSADPSIFRAGAWPNLWGSVKDAVIRYTKNKKD